MKTILMLDELNVIDSLRPHIESWGYRLIGLSKPDFMEDVIRRNEVDLIILAMEMRVAGPSLEGHFDGNLTDRVLKLKDTVVDHEFGLGIQTQLNRSGIETPIIFVSTEDMNQPKWHRDDQGKLYSAVFPKPAGIFSRAFREAIHECLEGR